MQLAAVHIPQVRSSIHRITTFSTGCSKRLAPAAPYAVWSPLPRKGLHSCHTKGFAKLVTRKNCSIWTAKRVASRLPRVSPK